MPPTEQLVDLSLYLRRRRYGASHGVGLLHRLPGLEGTYAVATDSTRTRIYSSSETRPALTPGSDFSPKPRLGACTLAVSDSDRSLRRSRSRCWVHEARGTSPARFWPLRSSAPSRRPARAAVRRSVPRGRQGEEPADARADARIWGDSPIPSRTASREPAQRRGRSPHVLGLPPALGACRPCSRRSLSFVGCAEHQQCSVDEEDQPTSGAHESGCLRDPPVGVAPDAGAVLGDGEVEALVGQRNLLGAAVQQRELEAEFGLDSFTVAS